MFEDTPRLPTSRWPLWAGIGLFAAYLALVVFFEPSGGQLMAVAGPIDGALLLWVLIRNLRYRIRLRRRMEFLRSLSDASRSVALSGLRGEPGAPLLEREVSWHGRPEVDGLVERFTFSPIDQREIRAMTIVSAAAALITALPIASVAIPVWGKFGLAGASAAFGAVAAGLRYRSIRITSAFEVSPFGLSEVRADSGIRRVLWDMPLVLRNNRRARQFELSVNGADGHIGIPYEVVQLERLVELIVEKGGLVSELSNQPLQPTSGGTIAVE